jgi:hypothetical protein
VKGVDCPRRWLRPSRTLAKARMAARVYLRRSGRSRHDRRHQPKAVPGSAAARPSSHRRRVLHRRRSRPEGDRHPGRTDVSRHGSRPLRTPSAGHRRSRHRRSGCLAESVSRDGRGMELVAPLAHEHCQRSDLRCRLSVPDREPLPNMGRVFQFVDHRDGEILNRDRALAGGVYQELVGSEAERSRALSGLQVGRWAQI